MSAVMFGGIIALALLIGIVIGASAQRDIDFDNWCVKQHGVVTADKKCVTDGHEVTQ